MTSAAPSSVAFCTTSSVLSPFSAPTHRQRGMRLSLSHARSDRTPHSRLPLLTRLTMAVYSRPLPSKRTTSSPSFSRSTLRACV